MLKSFFFGWKIERDESKCSSFSSDESKLSNAVLTTRLVKLSQTPNFFPTVRKRSKVLWVLRKNCFSSNGPQDTVNALWTLLTLSLLLRWKLPSARSPKRWQICIFFSKIVFPQNISWTQEIPLWQPLQRIRESSFFSQLKVRKNEKKSTFFSKSIFFQGVLWTQKMQFWLFCWNSFAKNRTSFWLKVKN